MGEPAPRFLVALLFGVALAAFAALLFEFHSLRGLYAFLFWPGVLAILCACFWVFFPLLTKEEMFAFRFFATVCLASVSFAGIALVLHRHLLVLLSSVPRMACRLTIRSSGPPGSCLQ